MGLAENVQQIFEGKIPQESIVVKTTYQNPEIQIYGSTGRGFRVPVERVEDFIAELQEKCVEPSTTYQFGETGETFDLPGFKLPNVAQYLREARDIGTAFAEFIKLF